MNLLALDLSSPMAGIAIFKDGALVAETDWKQERRGSKMLFEQLPERLADAGLEWTDIDVFAMGRGPGNYSGLRIALSALQALAAPGDDTVYTISSGEALVYPLEGGKVAVIGDARRERIWMGCFEKEAGVWRQGGDWELAVPDEVRECQEAGFRLISSECERLRAHLPGMDIEEGFPRAGDVGRAVMDRLKRNEPSEEVSPLYLHPAVSPLV